MSPTEDQLRAALRDGEGAGIDVDKVIARGRAVRHQRRMRAFALAAVTVAVAGVGTATGVILADRAPAQRTTASGNTRPSAAAASASQTPGSGIAAANGVSGAPQAGVPATALCPATLPLINTPSSGTGAMFGGPVSSIVLCSYPETGGRRIAPATTSEGSTNLVTGSAVSVVVRSLNDASTVRSTLPCPLYRTATGQILLMIGIGTNGAALAPVEAHVLQNTCNQAVTNGSAVRYNWSPPSVLDSYLLAAAAAGHAVPIGVGTANGSPANS